MAGKSLNGKRPDRNVNGTPRETALPASSLDVSLPQSVKAPGLARSALRRWIVDTGCTDEFVEDAALLVSEAVTNAVLHARSAPRLFATIADGQLRIEVHDTSHEPPVLRAPGATVGGKGLRIIAAAADAWGWSTTDTGKLVWTEQHLATHGRSP